MGADAIVFNAPDTSSAGPMHWIDVVGFGSLGDLPRCSCIRSQLKGST